MLRNKGFSQGYRGEVATKEALAIPPSGRKAQVPNLASCILDRDSKGSPLVIPHHARQGGHSLGRNVVCDQVAHAHDAIPHAEASARRRGMLRHMVNQCKGAGVRSISNSSRWQRACSRWRGSGLWADARGSMGLRLEGLHGDAAPFRRRVQSIHALLDFFHDGHVVRLQACRTRRVGRGGAGEVCEMGTGVVSLIDRQGDGETAGFYSVLPAAERGEVALEERGKDSSHAILLRCIRTWWTSTSARGKPSLSMSLPLRPLHCQEMTSTTLPTHIDNNKSRRGCMNRRYRMRIDQEICIYLETFRCHALGASCLWWRGFQDHAWSTTHGFPGMFSSTWSRRTRSDTQGRDSASRGIYHFAP